MSVVHFVPYSIPHLICSMDARVPASGTLFYLSYYFLIMKEKIKNKKNKKHKPKDKPLTLRRSISNIFYSLGIIQKAAPFYLVTYFMWSVGGAIFNFLLDTYSLRKVVNDMQEGRPLKGSVIFIIIIIAANMVYSVFIELLSQIIYPRYTAKIKAAFQRRLFEKAAKVDLVCYEDPKFYDKYVRAMENAYSKSMEIVYTIDGIVWSLVSFSANTVMILLIDPLLLLFGAIPLLIGLVRRIQNRVIHDFDKKRNPIDRKIAYVQRTYYLSEYAKEMRLTNIWKRTLDQQKEAWLAYKKLIADYGFAKGTCRFILNFGVNVFTVYGAMIYAAFRTLVTRAMLLGDCIVVFNSISGISWQLSSFVSDLADLNKSALYVEDYRFFLAYDEKIKDPVNAPCFESGKISVRNLTFAYKNAKFKALDDLSFDINPGEKIAIVGRNGSGKSTLVKLLLRLYDPDSGSITECGRDIREYKPDDYRSQFGAVFQDYRLFSMSVAENVLMRPLQSGKLKEEDELEVMKALELSGAYEKVSSFENGIHTTLTREFDEKGEELSGGEAQKVSVARAFIGRKPVLILDEPSAALDPVAEYNLFENILSYSAGRTVIFISHRLSSAVLADKIIYMDKGRIAGIGNHSELMSSCAGYAELFTKQAENYTDENLSEGGENDEQKEQK